jgi:hypothetical protein
MERKMGLIKPVPEDFGETPLAKSSANLRPEIELLRKSGVIKRGDGIEGHFVEVMAEVGLDPRSILSRIAVVMDSGESDGVKLQAARLAASFYMHPALVPQVSKTDKTTPQITFVVQSPQVSMNAVLGVPQGPQNSDEVVEVTSQNMESWK